MMMMSHIIDDDDNIYIYIIGESDTHFDMMEDHKIELETLCLRVYANMMDFNSTEDCVTAELQTWLQTVGKYFPLELQDKMPKTHKQLVSHFQKKMVGIMRIPACPADCSLLEGVRPTMNYVCGCDGEDNVAWRRTKGGNLAPVREFLTISLAEVIRSW